MYLVGAERGIIVYLQMGHDMQVDNRRACTIPRKDSIVWCEKLFRFYPVYRSHPSLGNVDGSSPFVCRRRCCFCHFLYTKEWGSYRFRARKSWSLCNSNTWLTSAPFDLLRRFQRSHHHEPKRFKHGISIICARNHQCVIARIRDHIRRCSSRLAAQWQ